MEHRKQAHRKTFMKPKRAGLTLAVALALAMLGAGCAAPSGPISVVEVSPGIFAGSKPTIQADFDALHAHGIRTILSLQQMPWDVYPERAAARKRGIVYRNVPILASPLQPREKRVKAALLILSDPSLRPIFVHCLLGKDRTALLVGLYRIYYQDWTPEAAWAEMLRSGFRVRSTLRGFDTYFWSHTNKPDWVIHGPEPSPP